MDRVCARYAAVVQSNGYRVEMITQENMIEGVKPCKLIRSLLFASGNNVSDSVRKQ